jgi:hypothetical protein
MFYKPAFSEIFQLLIISNNIVTFPGSVGSVCVVFVDVDGVKVCLWTEATNGPIVHTPGDM